MAVQMVGLGAKTQDSWWGASRAWELLPRLAQVTVGVAAALTVAAATWWSASTPWAVVAGAALLVLLAAAVVDAVDHRLPNSLVLAAAAPVAGGTALAAIGSSDIWVGVAAGAAVVGGPLLLAHLVSPSGLGFGDVKAGTVLGGGLGFLSPVLAAAGLMAGLIVSAGWAIGGRRRSVPLGPGMVGGGIAALAAGRVIGVEPW